jgi:DNA-binding NtrC family response regulator
MLDSTVWLLESVGLKALPFTSGREFLEACDSRLNACVLLDVRMPGMGGLNVQEHMRSRDLHLPVIFVSGHADVPIVVRAFKAGAHDFIEKPYNEQLLLDSAASLEQGRSSPELSVKGLRGYKRGCSNSRHGSVMCCSRWCRAIPIGKSPSSWASASRPSICIAPAS